MAALSSLLHPVVASPASVQHPEVVHWVVHWVAVHLEAHLVAVHLGVRLMAAHPEALPAAVHPEVHLVVASQVWGRQHLAERLVGVGRPAWGLQLVTNQVF